MIKHIILWKLKDMKEEEKARRMKQIKSELEGLQGRIPGMQDIHVIIEKLPTSNADMMLDSTFESKEFLEGYSVHPEHVFVADTYIRPFIDTRICMDFEITD